ncbi:MAG: TRAP transporter small permease [Roseovarius sp.]
MDAIVERLARLLLLAGQAGLFLMMILTVASITGRLTIDIAIPDSVTINEILMIFVVLLPMLAVQRDHAHVSVELLSVRRGSRAERRLHVIGCVVCAAAFLVLAWSLGISAIKALERHELYRGQFKLPVWPFRAVATLAVGALGAGFAMSAFMPPRSNEEAQKDE